MTITLKEIGDTMLRAEIKARVLQDYQRSLGRTFLVSELYGYVGDDSRDFLLSTPALVRVVRAVIPDDLYCWTDGWCDPYYSVKLVRPHPEIASAASLWVYGTSYHLNGEIEPMRGEIVPTLWEQVLRFLRRGL